MLFGMLHHVLHNLCRGDIPCVKFRIVSETLRRDFAWMMSDAPSGEEGFSFREVCDHLGVDHERLRCLTIAKMNRQVMREAGIEAVH